MSQERKSIPASSGTADLPPVLGELLAREPLPAGGVRTAEIHYDHDGTPMSGYLAVPAGTGPFPGVLVVHDWFGVGDYVRMRCQMLARLGYVAFAADIFGDGVRPTTEDEAAATAGAFYRDLPLLRGRVRAGLDRLRAEADVDASRLAAIGYCFGGSTVLQLARTGAELAGVVSFHGGLQTGEPGEAAAIRASLLVLTGAADPAVPDSAITAFAEELRQVPGLDWQVVIYSGAMHAFTIPTADAPDRGSMFDATAERRSWQAMKAFLAEVLA